MAWANRDFRSYPARCGRLHFEASADPARWLLIGAWKSELDAKAEATMLRQFRFLVRSDPGVDFALDKLLSDYRFRTRIYRNPFGDYCLYLKALRDISAEILALNPSLVGIV